MIGKLKYRFNTTIFKKILMAVTGLAMILFLIGHLIGNLQLLWSSDQFNAYAVFLTAQPIVIVCRAGTNGDSGASRRGRLCFAAAKLQRAARRLPIQNLGRRTKSPRSKKTWASTLMMWSGIFILVFIIGHVWHFKFHNPVASPVVGGGHDSSIVVGVANAGVASADGSAGKGVSRLAQMVVSEFRNPFVSGIYILSMLILGAHLYHAISSAMTSPGWQPSALSEVDHVDGKYLYGGDNLRFSGDSLVVCVGTSGQRRFDGRAGDGESGRADGCCGASGRAVGRGTFLAPTQHCWLRQATTRKRERELLPNRHLIAELT